MIYDISSGMFVWNKDEASLVLGRVHYNVSAEKKLLDLEIQALERVRAALKTATSEEQRLFQETYSERMKEREILMKRYPGLYR